jgi:hypothetical protein
VVLPTPLFPPYSTIDEVRSADWSLVVVPPEGLRDHERLGGAAGLPVRDARRVDGGPTSRSTRQCRYRLVTLDRRDFVTVAR